MKINNQDLYYKKSKDEYSYFKRQAKWYDLN